MSSPQEKFFSALNIAFHPSTKEGDILAGIRGAYRLLGGKTVKQFSEQKIKPSLPRNWQSPKRNLKGRLNTPQSYNGIFPLRKGKLKTRRNSSKLNQSKFAG